MADSVKAIRDVVNIGNAAGGSISRNVGKGAEVHISVRACACICVQRDSLLWLLLDSLDPRLVNVVFIVASASVLRKPCWNAFTARACSCRGAGETLLGHCRCYILSR